MRFNIKRFNATEIYIYSIIKDFYLQSFEEIGIIIIRPMINNIKIINFLNVQIESMATEI